MKDSCKERSAIAAGSAISSAAEASARLLRASARLQIAIAARIELAITAERTAGGWFPVNTT